MPKIKVKPHVDLCPDGAEFEAVSGMSVCENLLNQDIDIEHACELSCACTTCHVIFTEGFDSLNESTDDCLLYTSPSPRDRTRSRMPSSA